MSFTDMKTGITWHEVSWKEWGLERRMALLDSLNLGHKHRMDPWEGIGLDRQISTGEMEVFSFIVNPTHPVAFHKLDSRLGNKVLAIFTDFWSWNYNERGR